MRKELLLCCVFGIAFAQAPTQIDLRTQSKSIDFSAANTTKPVKTGTTLPAACSPGEMFYLLNAPVGLNLYGCTAANTWTQQGAFGTLSGDVSGPANGTAVTRIQGRPVSSGVPGAGQALAWNNANNDWEPETITAGGTGATMLLQMSDWLPSIADPTTRKTVAIGGLSTMVSCGSAQYPGPGGASMTLNAGSAAAGSIFWVYFDCVSGAMKVDANAGASLAKVTLAGITKGSNSASGFPANSIQIATVKAGTNAADTFDAGGITDCRTAFRQPVLNAGTGVGLTNNANGSQTMAFDANSAQYQAPWSGAVTTTVETKLARTNFDVCADFGAKCDYSTDDTARVQAAINAACSAIVAGNANATVVLNNNRISSALSFSGCTSGALHVHIIGKISLGAPLMVGKLGGGTFLYLDGEGQSGAQFQVGSIGTIYCDDTSNWIDTITTSSLYGTSISTCLVVSTLARVSSISVRAPNTGPGIYIPSGSATIHLDHVEAGVNTRYSTTSLPILIDSSEWLWIDHCVFGAGHTNYPASMHFTSTLNGHGAGGIIEISNTILAGAGIRVDGGTATPLGYSNVMLHNIETETIVDALVTVDPTTIAAVGWLIDGNTGMADNVLNPAEVTLIAPATAGSTTTYEVANIIGYINVPVGDGVGTDAPPLYFHAQGSGGNPDDTLTCTAAGLISGTVSTSGTAVTWVSGPKFGTLTGAPAAGGWNGMTITINGVNYVISGTPTSTSLTLTTSAGTQTGVAYSMPIQNLGGAWYTPGVLTCNAPVNSYAVNTSVLIPQPRIVRSLNSAKNSNISGWTINMVNGCGGNQVIADFPMQGLNVQNCLEQSGANVGNIRHAQKSFLYANNGLLDAELTAEGAKALTLAPFQSLGLQQNPALWALGGGSVGTITTGIADPWGGTSAATVNCTGTSNCQVSGASLLYNGSATLTVGDTYCVGWWMRSGTTTGAYTTNYDAMATGTQFSMMSSGSIFDASGNNAIGALQDPDKDISEGRWIRERVCGTITNAGSGTGYQFVLGVQPGSAITFAKPWVVYIPAPAGLSPSEIVRLERNLGTYPSNLAAYSGGPRLETYPETQLCWGSSCISQSGGTFTLPALNVTGSLTQNGVPAGPGYIRAPVHLTNGCASLPCTVSPSIETQEAYANVPTSYSLSSTAVVRVAALLSCSATTNQKTARIRIGPSSLTGMAVAQASNNTANAANNDLLLEGEMYWTGAAAQTSRNHSNSGGSSVTAASSMAWFHYADGATAYSLPLIAELTVQTSAGDSCTVRTFTVEVLP